MESKITKKFTLAFKKEPAEKYRPRLNTLNFYVKDTKFCCTIY